MNSEADWSDLSTSEKVRVAVLTARAAKRGLADDGTGNVDISDLTRRIERIERQAARRKNRS